MQLNTAIATAARKGNKNELDRLSQLLGPIEIINEILKRSNIHIELSYDDKFSIMASKAGGLAFPASNLSDGERNALLIAADVLTVPEGHTVLIDEPERHLHHSISGSLLTQLFDYRPDCAFVVSTHDIELPALNSNATSILLRGCRYADQTTVESWDADILEPGTNIPEDVKRELLGSRRKIIFVEGEDTSLDNPLYSILFPGFSVIPKGTCRDVINTVDAVSSEPNLTWAQVIGIIDNDQRDQTQIDELAERSIFAIPMHSVESIYYHPIVIRKVSDTITQAIGGSSDERFENAKIKATVSMQPHKVRLCALATEHKIRGILLTKLPKARELETDMGNIELNLDIKDIVILEKDKFDAAIENHDLVTLSARYKIRSTPALSVIAKEIGLQSKDHYQKAVLKALEADADFKKSVQSLLSPAYEAIISRN